MPIKAILQKEFQSQTAYRESTLSGGLLASLLALLSLPLVLLALATVIPQIASTSITTNQGGDPYTTDSATSPGEFKAYTDQHQQSRHSFKTIRAAIRRAPESRGDFRTQRFVTATAIESNPDHTRHPSSGFVGFEQQLVATFAHSIGARLELIPFDSVADMFDALQNGSVDMICSGYGASPSFLAPFKKGPSYRSDDLIAVYRVGSPRPRSANQLVGKSLGVVANSLASNELYDLQQTLSRLSWGQLAGIDYIDLLSRVESGELDVALTSRTEFQLYRGAFPRLGEAYTFKKDVEQQWIFGNGHYQHELLDEAEQFFVSADTKKYIKILEERYYSPSQSFKQHAANEFDRNLRRRLPAYRDVIKNVANEFNMDWRFLAAISYQESSWLPRAKSPTGVRGMMMLTQNTAKEMGIKNRLDVEGSLRGGAAYYNKLVKRIPVSVSNPDRQWMALAAYNFGYGHLRDARALTARQGGDPNLWHDVKQTLPLLQQRQYHQQTRYGFARGREALNYVQQIRHYNDVMVLREYVNEHQLALLSSPTQLQQVASLDSIDSQEDLAANF